ncbi:carboxyl transferase domain-containing protein [Allostreptomyces psammosilenae]|uniref:Acetyl-coenzyme A carboxylase carboxyl transferase subunits beta/alpha n=1 Tax=Allostreptomyces psammosilenae TaxID=1892865 RepID=A0A853A054_9ACTN|nr:carboxyl transferase domain-containing protein [Allostreptomyces psammosilenae]NYI03902.1 acetyl-CoA carboxylase carboxyl transferase subunit beta [Allostreptomyces psammosilenae]
MSGAERDGRRPAARAVIAAVADDFAELPAPPAAPRGADGPIGWPGYGEAHARARERTGEEESVVCGVGRVAGTEVVLIGFEFGFFGGSLGERTGDRLEAAYSHARERRLPVVSLVATGGSRMQEGMRALSQLQRVARQSALTRRAGLPQIAVVRDPTTGGGWATLGAGADVVLASPGAQIGFAGSRVRPPGEPAHAYTAEAQLASGHVDAVVPPAGLPAVLGRWLALLTSPAAGPVPPPFALGATTLPATGWEAVRRARSAGRPRAAAYLDAYFEWREEIVGDRCGGVDAGVLCGFGRSAGGTVGYVAQAGTATAPAGFRTAVRLLRLADRLGIPVLTLVDTPGAANDAAAERAGVGAAIAEAFAAVASAEVPITSLLIGEGGSGGALALAAPGRTWVTPDGYFSVTAPEAAAAILKRDPEQVPRTAEELRLRPQDLVELGVARAVVPPDPGVPAPHTAPPG